MPGPNAALQTARRQRGWKKSQLIVALERAAAGVGEKLPERANISRRIASWENDGIIPDDRYRSLLCTVYGMTPAELGFMVTVAEPVSADYPATVAEGAVLTDALCEIDLGDGALLPTALPGDWSSPAVAWLLARGEGDVSRAAVGRCVGMADVEAIRATYDAFMSLDFRFGGGHARTALVEYYRRDVRPLLDGSYTDEVGRALYVVAAELVQLLAWTAYDIGKHGVAQRYLIYALRLAQAADDRMLGGRMLASLSHQANYLGQSAQAAQLARAAQEGARGRATGTAMAMYAAHEARAHATAGNERAAMVAVREAEVAFNSRQPEDDPAWLHWFDAAELAGEFAHTFRDLGLIVPGREYVDQAIGSTDPAYARTLALVRMVRADLDLQRGEVEESLTIARDAVQLVGHLKSARARRYVTDYRTHLARYVDVPNVRAFLSELRQLPDLGSEAAPVTRG